MRFEFISQLFLVLSSISLLVFVFRKIPVISKLSETAGSKNNFSKEIVSKIANILKIILPLKNFSYDIFLQRILSKIRILLLKTDNKTSSLLKKMRAKAKFKNNLDSSYWEEIKKIKNKK